MYCINNFSTFGWLSTLGLEPYSNARYFLDILQRKIKFTSTKKLYLTILVNIIFQRI